jgi:hypothetical protein
MPKRYISIHASSCSAFLIHDAITVRKVPVYEPSSFLEIKRSGIEYTASELQDRIYLSYLKTPGSFS